MACYQRLWYRSKPSTPLFSTQHSLEACLCQRAFLPPQYRARISIIKEQQPFADLHFLLPPSKRAIMMASRRLITYILLFAVFTYGDQEFGELDTSNGDITGPSDSNLSVPANLNAGGDVFGIGGKAKFVGLSICGFDFGWSVMIKLLIATSGEIRLLNWGAKQQSRGFLRPKQDRCTATQCSPGIHRPR